MRQGPAGENTASAARMIFSLTAVRRSALPHPSGHGGTFAVRIKGRLPYGFHLPGNTLPM